MQAGEHVELGSSEWWRSARACWVLNSPCCIAQEQGKGSGGTELMYPRVPCQEHIEASRPSLYPSVVSNTSKEMSAFSDFPYPEDFPVFLPSAQLLDYLCRYAKCFVLRKHIKFGVGGGCPVTALLPTHAECWWGLCFSSIFQSTIVSIQKCPNFSTTGQWGVVMKVDGKKISHVFDAVTVCSGNFSEPSLPLHCFPGTVPGCLWLPASRG